MHQVPRDGDDVAKDRTGRRHAAGSLAVEHQRTGGLGLNEHGVERTAHAGERVLVRHQRRVHPDDDPRLALAVRGSALGHREQLDHVAGLGRPGHVLRGDRGDALPVHICRAHPGVEGEGGQDRHLRGGVVGLDVRRGVGLGVALLLRLLDGLAELLTGRGHLVQHVVGGAVDDPQHPGDPVPGEGLADRTDQRDGAADGGLEVQVDPGCLGGRVQGRPVLAQQLLVRGDDRCATGDGLQLHGPGRLQTADQLDHDVGPGHQSGPVGGQQPTVDDRVAGGVQGALGDPDQLQRRTDACRQVVGVGDQQAGHLGTDGSAAEQGHPYRAVVGCHVSPLRLRRPSQGPSERSVHPAAGPRACQGYG